jgi:hypothetical protein
VREEKERSVRELEEIERERERDRIEIKNRQKSINIWGLEIKWNMRENRPYVWESEG